MQLIMLANGFENHPSSGERGTDGLRSQQNQGGGVDSDRFNYIVVLMQQYHGKKNRQA